jgi:plasmid stabilization system protein ParE
MCYGVFRSEHTTAMPPPLAPGIRGLVAELDAEADERDVSRSDHIRNTLASPDRVRELEQENERLRRQLRAANSRQDDIGELVEYVKRERAAVECREERRQANIVCRAW